MSHLDSFIWLLQQQFLYLLINISPLPANIEHKLGLRICNDHVLLVIKCPQMAELNRIIVPSFVYVFSVKVSCIHLLADRQIDVVHCLNGVLGDNAQILLLKQLVHRYSEEGWRFHSYSEDFLFKSEVSQGEIVEILVLIVY